MHTLLVALLFPAVIGCIVFTYYLLWLVFPHVRKWQEDFERWINS